MTDEEFIDYVRKFKKDRNLTDHQIAEFLLVSASTVRRWVRGLNTPHPRMHKGIIKALETYK